MVHDGPGQVFVVALSGGGLGECRALWRGVGKDSGMTRRARSLEKKPLHPLGKFWLSIASSLDTPLCSAALVAESRGLQV